MSPERSRAASGASRRGQSETLGIVLVFSIMLVGAAIVVVFGAAAIGDSKQELSIDRAEKTLTQLDSKAALVALENTDVQQVELPSDGDGRFRVVNGTGWMNVTVQNTSDSSKDFELVNQSLGSILFDRRGEQMVYQGGGVWRVSGDGSVMVSPPEFHYRNGTLTLPIVNVTGDSLLSGRASLSHTDTVRKFPLPGDPDRDNPLDQHRVFVNVTSEYYEAWGKYFEQRTDGDVTYVHDQNKATLELVSPIGRQRITSAAASRAASGTFEIHGRAHADCGSDVYTNSYDSRQSGDYCSQATSGLTGSDGDVVYGADVDISSGSGSSDILGDVTSGGTVSVATGGGQPSVEGNISYTDSCEDSVADCRGQITDPDGEVRQISGVDTMTSVDLLVEDRVDALATDNGNGPVDIDSSDSLAFSNSSPSDEVTLPDGEYYLEDVVIDPGETLVLDATGGTVTAGIRGGIRIRDGGSITVQGDGVVELYVVGADGVHGRTYDVDLESDAGVLAPDDNATQIRTYGPKNLSVHLGDGSNNLARYVGVIFTPPGPNGTAEVILDGGEVYGGVLTGTARIDKGSIHYDEALATTQVISRNAKVAKVTYLHVTTNRIHVADG